MAYVQLQEHAEAGGTIEQQLRRHCRERLSPAAAPADFVYLDPMPLSAAGKVQRADLPRPDWALDDMHTAAWGHQPAGNTADKASLVPAAAAADRVPAEVPGQTAAPLTGSGWEGRVMQACMQVLQDGGLEPASNVFSRGCDSLAAADIASLLQIDVRLITAFPTARSLARHLSSMQQTPASSPAAAGRTSPTGRPTEAAAASSAMQPEHRPPRKRPRVKEACASQHVAQAEHVRPVQPPQPHLMGLVLSAGGQHRWCHPIPHTASPTSASDVAHADAVPHIGPAGLHPHHQAALDVTPAAAAAAAAAALQPADASLQPPTGLQCGGEHAVQELWRIRLQDCIDAAPVVLWQPPAAQSDSLDLPPSHSQPGNMPSGVSCSTAALKISRQHGEPAGVSDSGEARQGWRGVTAAWQAYAFACSHGGDVVCLDAHEGRLIWRQHLPMRADVGVALTADLQVGSAAALNGNTGVSSACSIIRCQM